MTKRLDPQTREELKFDLRMGKGTMGVARKFGLSPGTVTGYKQRIAKEDEKAANQPRLGPSGDIDMPAGLDPKEWLERVRDNPKAPWDARKAAGVQLYRNETTVKEDSWVPAEDPESWASDLTLLVLGQDEAVVRAVFNKLASALHIKVNSQTQDGKPDTAAPPEAETSTPN
jgi:hypothetical protein